MRVLRSRLFVACVAGSLAAIVGGGVAWALQSPVDGNGVIHACYNPSTGAVKLDTKGACPATGTKTPITWNAQGQPGPAGPPGPPGAGGGPAYWGVNGYDLDLPLNAPGLPSTDIVSVSVPPGNYFFTADVHVDATLYSQDETAAVTCSFFDGDLGGIPTDAGASHQWFGNDPLVGGSLGTTLTLNAVQNIRTGTIVLRCNASGTGTPAPLVRAGAANLIAQPVSGIIQAAPVP